MVHFWILFPYMIIEVPTVNQMSLRCSDSSFIPSCLCDPSYLAFEPKHVLYWRLDSVGGQIFGCHTWNNPGSGARITFKPFLRNLLQEKTNFNLDPKYSRLVFSRFFYFCGNLRNVKKTHHFSSRLPWKYNTRIYNTFVL